MDGEKEVLEYFLNIELQKHKKHEDKIKELLKKLSLECSHQLAEEYHDFRQQNGPKDTNPTLTWLKDEGRRNILNLWEIREVNLDDIYVERMNDSINKLLEDPLVKYNLSNLVSHKSSEPAFINEFREYDGRKNDEIIILIAKQNKEKYGSYELVDGAHRAVGMLLSRITKVNAFIGVLKG
jgi:hypothetical protein